MVLSTAPPTNGHSGRIAAIVCWHLLRFWTRIKTSSGWQIFSRNALFASRNPSPLFLTFAITALLVAGAILLIGDRVEGIGNCIVTDYDSGHGGEEAIYYSLAASGAMLLGMIFNVVGSFCRVPQKIK